MFIRNMQTMPIHLAHEFEKSADTFVNVHIDPNDEPIATLPATIFVDVMGEECGCMLLVEQSGDTIANLALSENMSSTTLEMLGVGPLVITVATQDDSFEFEYYVQPPPSQTLQLTLALGATVLVTGVLVGLLAWLGRKKRGSAMRADHADANTKSGPVAAKAAPLTPGALALVILGLVLLGVGVFYVLASHSVLEQIPGLAELPHNAHIYIGGGGAVLGMFCLLGSELLRRRRKD